MKKEVEEAIIFIKEKGDNIEKHNMKKIIMSDKNFKNIKANELVVNEAQKERLREAIFQLNRMRNIVYSLKWLKNMQLRRVARIYLRNLDPQEVATECGISIQTVYNHISDINTILTARFIQLGLPTVDEVVAKYYQI